MDDLDQRLLRQTFEIARRAREGGNQPFGTVLAGPDRQVLAEAGNTVTSDADATAHAEMNLLRAIRARCNRDLLRICTLYASTEPCPMCAGGIFWAGIGRVVFGLSTARLIELAGKNSLHPQMPIPCRAILSAARPLIEVSGPLLQAEAASVHERYWDTAANKARTDERRAPTTGARRAVDA